MNTITLILPEMEVEQFKEFQKNHALFTLLLKSGVFDQQNASVTLNFDHLGHISSIDRKDTLYQNRVK